MLEKILELMFPNSCGICGKIHKNWICPKCYYKIKQELKYNKSKEDNFNLYYIGTYQKQIRKILLKFKFKESSYLANTIIELVCKNKNMVQNIKKYDCIIPVPMYEKNKKIRGYNQSELLAKRLGKRLQIDYITNVLIKTKQNKRQSELDAHDRIENVKNAYSIINEELIKNKNILLIDDIYTTGNTVKSCIKELRKVNINKVDVLTIAKTQLFDEQNFHNKYISFCCDIVMQQFNIKLQKIPLKKFFIYDIILKDNNR